MTYEEKIKIMQHNLKYIRSILGLTEQDLGNMIGLTRQTISNIEYNKSKLSKVQYLAIMYVLEHDLLPNCNEDQRNYVLMMLWRMSTGVRIEKIATFEEEESR